MADMQTENQNGNEAKTRLVILSIKQRISRFFYIYHKPSPGNLLPSRESPKKPSRMMIYEFQISTWISCRPCHFSAVYCVDKMIFVNYVTV